MQNTNNINDWKNDELNEKLVPECYTRRQFRQHIRNVSPRLNAIEREKEEKKARRKEWLKCVGGALLVVVLIFATLLLLTAAFGS